MPSVQSFTVKPWEFYEVLGPYNQAIQVDNHLYVAGSVGFIPETMEIIEGGVVAETTQALTNMSK